MAAGISVAVAAVGTGFAIASSISAAKGAEATEKANAAQANLAAADQTRERVRKLRLTSGKQRAQFAAAGVVLDEGSPLLVLDETLVIAEQDIQAIEDLRDTNVVQARLRGSNARAKGRASAFADTAKLGGSFLTQRSTRKSLKIGATK